MNKNPPVIRQTRFAIGVAQDAGLQVGLVPRDVHGVSAASPEAPDLTEFPLSQQPETALMALQQHFRDARTALLLE